MKREIDKMGWDAKLILTVHDEIELEAHKDVAEEVARKLEELMVKAFHFYAPGVPMKASAKVADCWVH
jgi:DNA polymerase I-like protein with 3'-5' exonuclease and polymerase domains